MIPDALATGAAALRYWEVRQQIVANNLANVDTTGFKAERVFGRMLGDGTTVAGSGTDSRAGQLTSTGNPLDLAMGNGDFFVVKGAGGERLSRGGAFHLDAGGYVVDGGGRQLMGERGPIRSLGGTISVDSSGAVFDSGQLLDRLRVAAVPPGATLEHDAGTLFLPPPDAAGVPPGQRSVRQGFIERSNVDPLSSMVDMISIQRAYAAVQKSLEAVDGIDDLIANQLGRVS